MSVAGRRVGLVGVLSLEGKTDAKLNMVTAYSVTLGKDQEGLRAQA